MRVPQVKIIQPLEEQVKRLRVAAYVRVSSDSEDQLNSFSVQMEHYTGLIKDNAEWNFAGIYADEGITGMAADKRESFQRLLKDCRAGKIDRILVKSISRFARNSADTISVTRELKQLGVSIYFEKEGIDTADMGSEMLLSMLGAVAQEESVSISRNLQWGIRKRMQKGEYVTASVPFGYSYIDRTLVPNEKEAAVVRDIFQYYISGMGMQEIVNELMRNGIQPPRKAKEWCISDIQYSRSCLLFIWGFFPLLLIFFQIPIQIDLVDGGYDRVAEKIFCVGSCLAKAISCGSYAERCAEHILKLITKIVICDRKGIVVPLYTEHHSKPFQRDNGLDYGNEHEPCKVLRRV